MQALADVVAVAFYSFVHTANTGFSLIKQENITMNLELSTFICAPEFWFMNKSSAVAQLHYSSHLLIHQPRDRYARNNVDNIQCLQNKKLAQNIGRSTTAINSVNYLYQLNKSEQKLHITRNVQKFAISTKNRQEPIVLKRVI